MSYTIPTDEHVLVCGMTGSGKSFFAEAYLANYEYVIKLDIKGEYFERKRAKKSAWRGLVEGEDYVMVEHLADLPYCTTPKIIYCPDFDEQNEEFYDEFFKFCYMRENTIIWIDELMSVGTSSSCPRWLGYCMTRGRSKNVGVWSCTQRPSGIPSLVTANCKHFVVFDLSLDIDRKKLVEITGCDEMRENPELQYTFRYYKHGMKQSAWAVLK